MTTRIQALRLVCVFLCLCLSSWSVAGSGCTMTMLTAHDNHSSFTSSGYPVKFPPSACEEWFITTVDVNKTIVLETVDIKLPPDNVTHISIIDSNGYNKTLVGTDRLFLPTNASSVMVEFRSHDLLFTRGFKFNFYQASADVPCSREIEAEISENYLYSPGYPVGYYNNLQCNYTIRSKFPGYRLEINTLQSEIEDSYSCQYDSLTFIDLINNSTSEHIVATMCGDERQNFYSSGAVFKIMFVTNEHKANKGFRIRYRAVKDELYYVRTHATRLDSYLISPGYPYGGDRTMKMVWYIRSSGKTVELSTVDCDLPAREPNCTGHFVSVSGVSPMSANASETLNETSRGFHNLFCGNSTPSFSSEKLTLVTLISNHSDSRGLVMKYRLKEEPLEPVKCGGSLLASNKTQNQRSPGYPRASLQNQTCTWKITAINESCVILLKLIELDIDMYGDSFKLYDGAQLEEGNQMEIWQGQRAGEYVISSGRSLTVVYTLDDSDNGRGVSFNFTSVNGGLLSSTTKRMFILEAKNSDSYVNSPGYMMNFPVDMELTITFSAGVFRQNRVEFVTSNVYGHLLPSGTCRRGSITVYDGSSSSSGVLAGVNTESFTVCEQQEPVYISSGRNLHLVYKTRHSGHKDQGFLLKYRQGLPSEFTQEGQVCGGKLLATKQHGHISSPGYPLNYINHISCHWTITPTDNTSYVRLIPTDIHIEASSNKNCDYDSLLVLDGALISGTKPPSLLAKMCGETGSTVQSSIHGGPLTVVFTTDGSNSDKGFLLDYFETEEPPPCVAESRVSMTPYQYKTPGYIYNTIPANVSCSWTLYYEYDMNIKLSIKSNYVMTDVINDTCSSYYLDIYDGDSEDSLRLARMCGKIDRSFVGSGTKMFVKLVTGDEAVPGGYIIKFELASEDLCGDSYLTAYTTPSVLTSPYYPSSYPSNMECVWHIDAGSYNEHVVMEVVSMDVDDTEGCGEDHLIAYDSYSTSSPFDRWCGKKMPTYESTGEYMTIKFHSSSAVSTPKTGFKLKYWSKYVSNHSDYSYTNVGAIIGGVIGGIACIILIVVAIFCITQKPFSPKPILRTTGPSYPQAFYQPGQQHINLYHQPQTELQAHSNPTYAASSTNLPRSLPTSNVDEQSEPAFTKL